METDNQNTQEVEESQGELTPYELVNNLKPVSSLTELELPQEKAKIDSPSHEFWDGALRGKPSPYQNEIILRRDSVYHRLLDPAQPWNVRAAEEKERVQKEEFEKIQARNEEEESRRAQARSEMSLQAKWGADWQKNLTFVQNLVAEGLTVQSREILETVDPRTGRALGDDAAFIEDLFNLLQKHGVAR